MSSTMKFVLRAVTYFTFYYYFANCSSTEILFISDYFSYRNILFSKFFVCWNSKDLNIIQKKMWDFKIRTSVSTPLDYVLLNDTEYFKSTSNNYGCVLDTSCPYFEELLQQVSIEDRFHPHYKWLIISLPQQEKNLQEVLESLRIRLDSDITLAIFNENQQHYYLYDLYNPGFNCGGRLRINFLGEWNKNLNSSTLKIPGNLTIYARRIDMSEVHLRATTVVTQNISTSTNVIEYLQKRELVNQDSMTKSFFALFLHLRDVHNFSYTLRRASSWYGYTPGGNDAGLSKELSEDLTDIPAAGATMTHDRVKHVDYSVNVFYFKTCFMFRDKGNFKNEFIHSFQMKVWLAIFVMIIIISVLIKCTYSHENTERFSFMEAFVITLGGMCQQGSSYYPKDLKSNCVLVSLLLMSMVLNCYYSTVIVSRLLNSRPRAITTLMELAESDMTLGAEDIIYLRQQLVIRNSSDVQKIRNRLQIKKGDDKTLAFFSIDEGTRRVRNEEFAYHSEVAKIYPVASKTFGPTEICDLSEICLYDTNTYFLWKKKSEHRNFFSMSYRRMDERGLIQRQRGIWQAKRPACMLKGNFVSVGIERASLTFVILFTGMGFAVVIFLLEIICHRFTKK